MKKVLDAIFERELARLDELSRKEALDIEELRRLETMTRALKNYQEPERATDDGLSDISTEDLIKLIRGEGDGEDKAEPKPRLKGPPGRRKKAGDK